MIRAFEQRHHVFQPEITPYNCFRPHYQYAWLSSLIDRSGTFYEQIWKVKVLIYHFHKNKHESARSGSLGTPTLFSNALFFTGTIHDYTKRGRIQCSAPFEDTQKLFYPIFSPFLETMGLLEKKLNLFLLCTMPIIFNKTLKARGNLKIWHFFAILVKKGCLQLMCLCCI